MRANAAFLRLTEFSREDVVGNTAIGLGLWTAEERATIVAPLFASAASEIQTDIFELAIASHTRATSAKP